MPLPVLLILEDEPDVSKPFKDEAESMGYDVIAETTVEAALLHCRGRLKEIVVALVDLRIRPEQDFTGGWNFLKDAGFSGDTQVIILTGHPAPGDLQSSPPFPISVSYIFLTKNRDEDRVYKILEDQLSRHRIKLAGGVVHESDEDVKRLADLPMIAASGLPVLITGESGSGKEYFAQKLAQLALPSSQHDRIHTVNCATLTETFAIATLLGYDDGAFTGARKGGDKGILRRISGTMGRDVIDRSPFQEADLPGILILDELAELSPFVQAQLLRVLQRQKVNALGDSGDGYTPVIRVIACTHDEKKLANSELFRQDLLGRLDGWHLTIDPPHKRRDTFVQAARMEALSFSMTLDFGKPPVKISDVDVDVDVEVATKLVPKEAGGLRFGFRELKGWIGRACALALYKARNDTQLTAAHLRTAWDKRMKLGDTDFSNHSSGDRSPAPPPITQEIREEADKLRKEFITMFRENAVPISDIWTGPEFKRCFNAIKKLNTETAATIRRKAEDFSSSDLRAKLILITAFQQHDKLTNGELKVQTTIALTTIRSYFKKIPG